MTANYINQDGQIHRKIQATETDTTRKRSEYIYKK